MAILICTTVSNTSINYIHRHTSHSFVSHKHLMRALPIKLWPEKANAYVVCNGFFDTKIFGRPSPWLVAWIHLCLG